MATLSATFDHDTGATPHLARTHDDIALLIERLARLSSRQSVPALAEVVVHEDPYGKPYLYVGVAPDRGVVWEPGEPGRWTHGQLDVEGDVTFDYVGHGHEIPARHLVPLDIVHAVLATYLDHDGAVPDDNPHLRPEGHGRYGE